MALRLPRFDRSIPIVNDNKTPTLPFHQWWDRCLKKIEEAINGIQAALLAAGIALDAAEVAQAAADAANAAAESVGEVSKLSGSGVTGMTFTASDVGSNVTVTVSAHTRAYSDGTSVAVNGGSIAALAYSTTYYVYYNDPTFAGGAVTYLSTTVQTDAIQTGDRHLVGQVTTPAAGQPDKPGLQPQPPGFGNLQ